MLVRPTPAGVIRITVLAFVVFAYFMPRWADWNIDSRLDLVHAIVDRHSLNIDAYHFNTWDKAYWKNHYYSDKAPGTAVLGAAVYGAFTLARSAPLSRAVVRAVEASPAWLPAIQLGETSTQNDPAPKGTNLGGCQRNGGGNVQYIPWGNRLVPPMRDWALSKYVVTIGTVGLVAALFAGFFFWFLGFFALSGAARWALTGLYAFATDALPYSTNFYSHQIAAACLFAAFGLLFLHSQDRIRRWAVPVAGFLLGFSLFTEYTVAAIAVVIGVYGLWLFRRSPATVGRFALAGAVPVLALFAYNTATFGNPLDTGYAHDYCWSAAQGAGFAGFTYPHLGPLFDLTFGTCRGLFFMSPFLLLAIPGMYEMARRGYRAEAAVCLVAAVGFIVLLSAYWGWNGGKVEGPRYLVPVIPFLAFPIILVLERFRRSLVAWSMFLTAGAWSMFVVWAEFLGGALFPTSWLRNPLVDYSLPALAHDEIPPNLGLFFGLSGWRSLIPLALVVGLVVVWGRWGGGRRTATSCEPVGLSPGLVGEPATPSMIQIQGSGSRFPVDG